MTVARVHFRYLVDLAVIELIMNGELDTGDDVATPISPFRMVKEVREYVLLNLQEEINLSGISKLELERTIQEATKSAIASYHEWMRESGQKSG